MDLQLLCLIVLGELAAVIDANDATCVETDMGILMSHFRKLRAEVNELKKSHEEGIVKLKEQLRPYIGSPQGEALPPVSFVAHHSIVNYKCTANITQFPFDNIMLNDGDAFNKSGYFRAPLQGIYAFSSKVCMHPDSTIRFSIFSQSTGTTNVRSTTGYLTTRNEHDCFSMSAVVDLKTNELVYIGAECKSGILEGGATTFTGTLIHLTEL